MSTEELRIAELRSRIQALRPQGAPEPLQETTNEEPFAKVLEARVQEPPSNESSPTQDLSRTVEDLQTAQSSFQQMQRLQEQLLLAYHQTLPAEADDGGQKTVTPTPEPKQ